MPYQEPQFLPWDGKRVPLTFISGYLGAGKTTLINDLLASTDLPIAVLVNDVGEVNVDAELIKRRHADTIELTDGCVCCSLSDGFGAAFDQLRERPIPPAHVVVELSGVADPTRVLPWSLTAGFRLDGVVTLVDCDQFRARETQVGAADLLVLTKTDLVQDIADVRQRLHEMAPGTPIVEGSDIGVSLLQLGGNRTGGITDVPASTLFDQHVVKTERLPRPISRGDLDQLLSALPSNTVRAKGIAIDESGVHWLIQLVGRRVSVTELPEAEAQEPTDLVVISLP